ncbi:MAG: hypothetical protein R6U54_00190 [Candidatus Omnitrophota bacterium]
MILIVVAVIISISIFLLAFVSFSPHFISLTESDFMRRANENATLAGLKWGELKSRADSFPDEGITTYMPLRRDEDSQSDEVLSDHFLKLEITEQGEEINVDVSRITEAPKEDLF